MWCSDSCFRAHNVSFKGSADLSLFVWILKPTFWYKKNPYKSNNHHLWTSMEGRKKLGDSNLLHWPFSLWSWFEKQNGESGKKTGIKTILTFWGIKKELLSYQPFFRKKLNRTILAFVYLLFFIKSKSLPKKTIRFLRFSSNYIMDRLFPLWIGLILFVFNYYNYWRKHWFSLHSPSMLCFWSY